jgi:hypothetical protein
MVKQDGTMMRLRVIRSDEVGKEKVTVIRAEETIRQVARDVNRVCLNGEIDGIRSKSDFDRYHFLSSELMRPCCRRRLFRRTAQNKAKPNSRKVCVE